MEEEGEKKGINPLMRCLLEDVTWIENFKEGDRVFDDDDEKHEDRVIAAKILAGFDRNVKHAQTRLYYKPRFTTMQKRRFKTANDYQLEECVRTTKRRAKNLWTVYDDRMLESAVRRAFRVSTDKYACPWTRIANVIFNGEKTGKQCMLRWENHVDNRLNKGKWSPGDTITLIRSLCNAEKRGSKTPYMDASVSLRGTRSRIACRNKWMKLRAVISKRKHIQLEDATPTYVLKIIET